MPAPGGAGRSDDQIPLAEFARALRRALVDEDKLCYEVGDCELVHQAVDYDKTGIVGVDEMSEFLEGPGLGLQNTAASKIQARHRGKKARRRVSAKTAASLADSAALDGASGQTKDSFWRKLAVMPPHRILELIFQQIDDKRSGTVSRRELRCSEFAGVLTTHWKTLNTNDDKNVSMREWEEFWGDMFTELGQAKYAATVVEMAWQGKLRMPEDTGDISLAPVKKFNAPGMSPEKKSGGGRKSPPAGGGGKKAGAKKKKKKKAPKKNKVEL